MTADRHDTTPLRVLAIVRDDGVAVVRVRGLRVVFCVGSTSIGSRPAVMAEVHENASTPGVDVVVEEEAHSLVSRASSVSACAYAGELDVRGGEVRESLEDLGVRDAAPEVGKHRCHGHAGTGEHFLAT